MEWNCSCFSAKIQRRLWQSVVLREWDKIVCDSFSDSDSGSEWWVSTPLGSLYSPLSFLSFIIISSWCWLSSSLCYVYYVTIISFPVLTSTTPPFIFFPLHNGLAPAPDGRTSSLSLLIDWCDLWWLMADDLIWLMSHKYQHSSSQNDSELS